MAVLPHPELADQVRRVVAGERPDALRAPQPSQPPQEVPRRCRCRRDEAEGLSGLGHARRAGPWDLAR